MLLAALGAAARPLPAQRGGYTNTVLRIRVNPEADRAAVARALAELGRALPPSTTVLARGKSIASLVEDRFGTDPTDQAHDSLLALVRRLNAGHRVGGGPQGDTILIPSLPPVGAGGAGTTELSAQAIRDKLCNCRSVSVAMLPMAPPQPLAVPAAALPSPAAPRPAVPPAAMAAAAAPVAAPAPRRRAAERVIPALGVQRVSLPVRGTARPAQVPAAPKLERFEPGVLEVHGPEAAVLRIAQGLSDSVGEALDVSVPYATLTINWATATPLPEGAPVLSAPERARLHEYLDTVHRRRAGRGPVLLFVLDSGWPTAADRSRSVAVLDSLVNVARLGAYRNLDTVESVKPASTMVPPGNPHCAVIAQALAEFVALDSQRVVQVVYVPMSREQGARDVLQHLIETQFMLASRDWPRDSALVRADTKRALDGIPATAAGARLRTSTAIVSALYDLVDQVSRANHDFYVVNESWTVVNKSMPVLFPAPPRAIGVSAAGNDSVNFVHQLVDFGERSFAYPDHVAVMNMNRRTGALQCRSNFVAERDVTKTHAVGFDGVAGGQCATSFAAPRVSWLLAALEAGRRNPLEDVWSWSEWLVGQVGKLRSGDHVSGMLLSVTSFLQIAGGQP